MTLAKTVAIGALSLQALGCGWLTKPLGFRQEPDYVFPRLDSARAQYSYAAQIHGNAVSETREKLQQIIAAYQQVLDYFAEDELWTPLALAQIGVCYFRMANYRKTIEVMRRAKQAYPNYPFVHAQAECWIGRSLENMGRHREAKEHYKRCMDTFRHNKNTQIQEIVGIARTHWIRPAIPE